MTNVNYCSLLPFVILTSQEIEIGADYELANRHSSDKLLSQIYCRRQDSVDSMLTGSGRSIVSGISSSTGTITTIHDELAQLKAQMNRLQRAVDQLPERICALLMSKQQQQQQAPHPYSRNTQSSQPLTMVMDVDVSTGVTVDEEDDFDKLSSSDTSLLSDIEILNESIEENNRDLLAWCRRLQLNDITNHITVEPKTEPQESVKQKESRFESNLFTEWEKRYSTASEKPQISIVTCTKSGVPTLIPNYSSEVDKNIWLK